MSDTRNDFSKFLVNKREVFVRFEIETLEHANKLQEMFFSKDEMNEIGATGIHWDMCHRNNVIDDVIVKLDKMRVD